MLLSNGIKFSNLSFILSTVASGYFVELYNPLVSFIPSSINFNKLTCLLYSFFMTISKALSCLSTSLIKFGARPFFDFSISCIPLT